MEKDGESTYGFFGWRGFVLSRGVLSWEAEYPILCKHYGHSPCK